MQRSYYWNCTTQTPYWDGPNLLFVFEAQDEPFLSRGDAPQCIVDLVQQLVLVLEGMHALGWVLLDVGLLNICFMRGGSEGLIDWIG